MKHYDFTLKFSFNDASTEPEQYVNVLGENGCDDAIIGIGQKGIIALQFYRLSNNALDAILSAIVDVKQVIPEVKLVEASPDLVGLSDIAELIGVSRQNVRKLMLHHSDTFPLPTYSGKTSLWHLSGILDWFEKQQNKALEPTMMEVARANLQVNLAKDLHLFDSGMQSRLSDISF